ncbi:MAG: aminopeptidase [Planctomycetes bacterium]|jgi:aminopeptidase|nr:aminopeptidase [Phycisphaerae bacterium]NBB94766.1 aminopeptidase [Planctomycetota bacterium]
MPDPRVTKLAELLTRYSLRIRKGDYVLIRGSSVAAPLIQECYRHAVRAGANIETAVSVDGLSEIFYKEASTAQLEWISPTADRRYRKIDAMYGIWGEVNTRSLTHCDPKKMATAQAAHEKLTKVFSERSAKGELRWVGTQWPTQANAQDAEMSLAEYEDFVFKAGHLDAADPVAVWKAISKAQAALKKKLDRCKEVRIVAGDTDLTFACQGRTWENCDGRLNFPDGEVFTGPVEESVNGHVRFSFPAVHHGREVNDVFLEFKDGKVVKANASKGEEFLRAMIDMDAGACRLGEAAFGTNYNITTYTRNTLFDEKIGGTIHLALGAGYPETGSTNRSGLHWDMVCDLRDGGEIYADGTLIQKDGRFLDDRFPQPQAAKPKGKAARKRSAGTSPKKKSTKKKTRKKTGE